MKNICIFILHVSAFYFYVITPAKYKVVQNIKKNHNKSINKLDFSFMFIINLQDKEKILCIHIYRTGLSTII